MKYLISIVIFFNLSIYAQFAGGSGTSIDPYQISTPTQLDSVRNHKSSYFILNNDINLQGYTWTPIDTIYATFSGNGHTIRNMTISATQNTYGYGGLFCFISSSAKIYQLRISHFIMNITGSSNNYRNGILVGVSLSNSVSIDSVVIDSSYIKYVASTHQDVLTGGMIGQLAGGSMNRCAVLNSSIIDSIVSNPNGMFGAAGLAMGSGTFTKCYVSNTLVKAVNWSNFGVLNSAGLVGSQNAGSQSITDCYFNGTLYSNNDASWGYVGGIVGTSSSTSLLRCYTVPALQSAENLTNKMTFVTRSTITGSENYCDTTVSNSWGFTLNPAGSSNFNYVNTSAMKTKSTYSGWDFANTWGISATANNGYPYLKWGFVPTVIAPISNYYYKDSTLLVIINAETSESDSVFISYGFDYHYKTILTHDTANIVLDSLSTNAKIKLINTSSGVTVYSQSFQIVNTKTAIIDTVYINPTLSPTINIVALLSGITSVSAYYSNDTTNNNWTYCSTFNISNQLPHIDTLSSMVNFVVNGSNSYYKLVEVKDTTAYNLTMSAISNFGLIANPQICLNFKFNDNASGPGGNDIKDVGCDWVSNITKYYGTVSTVVNADGTVSAVSNETAYPYPYTGMPALVNNNTYTSIDSLNPLTYYGREYWVVTTQTSWYPLYDLWMKDLTNNVSYPVLHIGGGGAGLVGNWSSAQASVYYSNIAVFRSSDGLAAFSTKLLSFPPQKNVLPIFSLYHLVKSNGGVYNYFRDYFRGIYPKAPIDMSGGK